MSKIFRLDCTNIIGNLTWDWQPVSLWSKNLYFLSFEGHLYRITNQKETMIESCDLTPGKNAEICANHPFRLLD